MKIQVEMKIRVEMKIHFEMKIEIPTEIRSFYHFSPSDSQLSVYSC